MPIDEPETREDLLKRWQGRVAFARLYQQELGNQANTASTGRTRRRWDENVAALAGDFGTHDELDPEAVDVNVVRASAKVKLPPLKLVQPKISVNPTVARYKGQNNILNAPKVQAEINYWFQELDVRRQMSKALTDTPSTNCGYLYVGMVDSKSDAYDSSGDRIENNPQVRHKQPFVKRKAPKEVLVPEGFWDLEDCPWVDIIFLMPKRHVVKKFNVDPDEIKTTEKTELKFDDRDASLKAYAESGDLELVEVHNVWDKETKKVYIFAKDMEDFLEEPKDWPWEVEGFPLVHLRPEEISDQYYGTPPTTYIMPQQRELNFARTSTKKRFGKSKSTVWVSDAVDEQVVEAYKKNPDGGIIRANLGGEDIRKHVMIDNGLPLDEHGIAYGQVVKADIIEQDGSSSEQRGGGDPNVDSATASANIQRNLNIRNSEAADMVRTAYLAIARKLWMMIANSPSVSVVRRIEGPIAGAFTELRYSTSELRGEFQFNMDFSARIPDTDEEKIQKAFLRYKLFRVDPLVNPKELILDVYKAQGELNPESKLVFLRSPQEELQMFMQGLHAEANENDDHQQHVQLHEQQAGELEEAIAQLEQQLQGQPTLEGGGGNPDMDRLRQAQILLVTHTQGHFRLIQQITGQQQQGQQGQNENSVRRDLAAINNDETEAELEGNPLGPVN